MLAIIPYTFCILYLYIRIQCFTIRCILWGTKYMFKFAPKVRERTNSEQNTRKLDVFIDCDFQGFFRTKNHVLRGLCNLTASTGSKQGYLS